MSARSSALHTTADAGCYGPSGAPLHCTSHHTSHRIASHFASLSLSLFTIHSIHRLLASSRLRGEDSTPSVVELLHARRDFTSRGNLNYHRPLLHSPNVLGAGECYSKNAVVLIHPSSFVGHHRWTGPGHQRRTGPSTQIRYSGFSPRV